MKNFALTGILFLSITLTHAQQRLSDGSGDSNLTVSQNAILELVSKNKGLLHTKVALLSTANAAPMSSHVAGLMVYNTETRYDVVAGIYYNDGEKWVLASGGKATSITYNPVTYEMSFIDADGKPVSIDFRKVVKANETLTVLDYNANVLTYKNEAGSVKTISLQVGRVAYDKGLNSITYTDGAGKQTTLALNETGLRYNTSTKELIYRNSLGIEQVIDLSKLVGDYQTTTILKDNADGTFTYTNELGIAVTFDANTTKVDEAGGIYIFKDGAGNVITTINSNAVGIIFNNASNGLVSTNVQTVIEELLSKIKTVEGTKGDLSVSGGIGFTSGSDGVNKLLGNTGIEIADAGVVNVKIANGAISTSKVADKNITAVKLTAGAGDADRLAIADAAGNVVYSNLVPVSSIVGQNVTASSDKIKLGGNPEGAALKAFSIDVDETKLLLDANQIKGGTEGQVIVADSDGKGTWVEKKDVTTVNNSSVVNSLTTTVNGTAGEAVKIVNTNALSVDADNNLVSTVNGVASSPLDLETTIKSKQKRTLVTRGRDNSIVVESPEHPDRYEFQISVKQGGVQTVHLNDNAVTAGKLGAEGVALGYVPVAQGDGKVVYGPVSSENIVGKNMEAADGSISITDGKNATLINTKIKVNEHGISNAKLAADAVTSDKIKNGTIAPEDIAKAGVNEILITDSDGLPNWKSQSDLSLNGDITGKMNATVISEIQGKELEAQNPSNGNVLLFKGGKWITETPSTDATTLTNGQALSSTDLEFSANADKALLSAVTANIKKGAVTTDKLGAESADAGKVPVVQEDGTVVYQNISADNVVGKSMKASDGSISIVGGAAATLSETTIQVKDAGIITDKLADNAVTSAKIKDATIIPADLANAKANEVLVTDGAGRPQWKPQNELIQEVKADNGLSATANTVQLGGGLIQPTRITTTEFNTLAIAGLDKDAVQATETGNRQHLVVLGSDNVLKAVKAAMPKFFYMPSVILPTAPDQIHERQKDLITYSGEIFNVNLYGLYVEQFSEGASPTKTVNQNRTTKLPVLASSELDYYITYFDNEVYVDVKVDGAGVLTYKISSNADSTGSAYMNIVFAIRP